MKLLRILILVALVAPGVAVAIPPQDDGGTGGDASDEASSPTSLPAYGAYDGAMRARDKDWFGVPDPQAGPVCLTLEAAGTTYSDVALLARHGGLSQGVAVPLPRGGGTTGLAVATTGIDATVMGVLPVPNPAGHEPARPGAYTLDVARRTFVELPRSDGGGSLGNDGAVPLPQSPCVAGKLDPTSGLGNIRDAFAFTAHAGEQVVYSLGALGGTVTMRIEDGAGQVLSPEIGSGDIATFTFPENGTFELAVVAPADGTQVDYVAAALGIEWPPSNPCRPHCLAIQES